MENSVEITDGTPCVGEDKIFVAVGNVMKESISTLLWALQNFRGKNFCILHVHQPSREINIFGGKFKPDELNEQQVRTHREEEKRKMVNILNQYLDICSHARVCADKIYIVMDNIEVGIIELIAQRGITKLVMGAAANKHYSKNLAKLESQKAKFVFQRAPISCSIWFVCKDKRIVTREGVSGRSTATEATTSTSSSSSSLPPVSPIIITGRADQPRNRPNRPVGKSYSHNDGFAGNLAKEPFRRVKSAKCDTAGGSAPSPRATSQSPIRLTNPVLGFLQRKLSRKGKSSRGSRSPDETVLPSVCESNKNLNDSCPANELSPAKKPEKTECLDEEEEKKGRELEDYERQRQELEKLKIQRDQAMEELRIAQDQKVKLESQIADSDRMVVELIQKKVLLAAQKLAAIEKELDDELQKLKKIKPEDFASLQRPDQFFLVFSASEIESATQSFNPTMKIGEGGFGNVYRGHLRQLLVAIKRFHHHSLEGQSSSDFQREVDVLSKVSHPNLVTLIGTCPEASSLVLEYLPNGSLEDRLNCKNGTPPLSWKTRIRIAKEICSALIFLHSNKPLSIVHGDLKPANILLDANLVTKLGDFGIASFIARNENSTYTTIMCCPTNPKGTLAYIDPEFVVTGVLTPKADVYAFGVVLLQVLTGRPAKNLPKQVQFALDQGTLNDMLDASAGDWPLVQAKQLAQMALSCCEFYRENRPNLELEVLKLFQLLEIEI